MLIDKRCAYLRPLLARTHYKSGREKKKKENFEVFFNVQINALIFINNKYT